MEQVFQVLMNTDKQRFEVSIGTEFAYIDFRYYKGNLAFMHTFVPEVARGMGVAGILAKYGLEYARGQHLKIMVYCPFVASYIKRHPEFEDLKNPDFHLKT